MRALLFVGLAACSASPRGPVTVRQLHRSSVVEPDDRFVLFVDADGTSRKVDLDASNEAVGELGAGGSVILVGHDQAAGAAGMEMYTDVEPGRTLEFGPPALVPHAPLATLDVHGVLPGDADQLTYTSACGAGIAPQVNLDDRCGAATDLVLVACRRSYIPATALDGAGCEPVAYTVLTAQPVIDGAAITIDPAAWRPFDEVTIDVHDTSGIAAASTSLSVITAYGVQALAERASASRLTAQLPAIGPVEVQGLIGHTNGSQQTFTARLADPHVLDLHDVLAPWVTQSAAGWTTDDDAGGLVAHTLVTTFTLRGSGLTIYGAPSSAGALELPDLPRTVTAYVADDPLLERHAQLVRVEGLDPAIDPQRAANIVLSGGDPGGTSYAVTSY